MCQSSADEELRPIGARTSIGHAKNTDLIVLQFEVLIFKLAAINGLATSSVATSEVATLSRKKDGESVIERGGKGRKKSEKKKENMKGGREMAGKF